MRRIRAVQERPSEGAASVVSDAAFRRRHQYGECSIAADVRWRLLAPALLPHVMFVACVASSGAPPEQAPLHSTFLHLRCRRRPCRCHERKGLVPAGRQLHAPVSQRWNIAWVPWLGTRKLKEGSVASIMVSERAGCLALVVVIAAAAAPGVAVRPVGWSVASIAISERADCSGLRVAIAAAAAPGASLAPAASVALPVAFAARQRVVQEVAARPPETATASASAGQARVRSWLRLAVRRAPVAGGRSPAPAGGCAGEHSSPRRPAGRQCRCCCCRLPLAVQQGLRWPRPTLQERRPAAGPAARAPAQALHSRPRLREAGQTPVRLPHRRRSEGRGVSSARRRLASRPASSR
jgi:hypothetical protein